MKTRYLQNYQNECGLYAIKNLLHFYKIRQADSSVTLCFNTQGTNLKEMKNTLSHYFNKVEVIRISVDQLKKISAFRPQIILIAENEISHYVVLYKMTRKYVFLADSLYKNRYRLSFRQLEKIFTGIMIVCEEVKTEKKKSVKKNYSFLLFAPLINFLETIFLLSSTVVLQQFIDEQLADGILYGAIQLFLLCLIAIKIRMYLKMFTRLDQDLVLPTVHQLFHLQDEYYHCYPIQEIYYRLWDAYQLKGMYLAIFFSLLPDLLLSICILILLCIYQFHLTLLILLFLLPAVFISLKIFYRSREIVESRRKREAELLSIYQSCLQEHHPAHEEKLKNSLLLFQKEDYKMEKLTHRKNQFLAYYQSILLSFLILCYFCGWFTFRSIGSLIAMLNMTALLLQPILNICSTITLFSNRKLLCQRLKDLKDHQR